VYKTSEIPHHSTFSKNRHGRFQESKLFEQLFKEIVKRCVEVGLGAGQAPVSGWQFRGGECNQEEPHSAGAIIGRSTCVRGFYPHLLRRRKAPSQAVVAVMRKFLHAFFAMFRLDQPDDGSKLCPTRLTLDTVAA
jgi:hypothetical protein